MGIRKPYISNTGSRTENFGDAFYGDVTLENGGINTPKRNKALNTDVSKYDSVIADAENLLLGKADFKNAGKALSQGHLGEAASSAAWGALSLGSTIGSAFVGPELKGAELALQTARATRAAKMARSAKSLGVNAAVSAGASVLGNEVYHRFATPTTTNTPTEDTPSPTGTGTDTGNKRPKPGDSGFNSGMQFAQIAKVF